MTIGARRGDQRIGICALADDGLAVLLEPHGDFGLRVGAFGHGVHLIEEQAYAVRHDGAEGVEGGVDRAIAGDLRSVADAVEIELDFRGLRPFRAGYYLQRYEPDALVAAL